MVLGGISDIVLMTKMDDGAWAQSDHGHADILIDYLRVNYQGETLTQVDEYARNRQRMRSDVFIGAIPYLDLDALLKTFEAIHWEFPQAVSLMIRNESSDVLKVYRIEESI